MAENIDFEELVPLARHDKIDAEPAVEQEEVKRDDSAAAFRDVTSGTNSQAPQKKKLVPVPQPQSAYVLFVQDLRKTQKAEAEANGTGPALP